MYTPWLNYPGNQYISALTLSVTVKIHELKACMSVSNA